MVEEILEIQKKLKTGDELKEYDGIFIHLRDGYMEVIGVKKSCEVKVLGGNLSVEFAKFICEFCKEDNIPLMTCLELPDSVCNFFSALNLNGEKYVSVPMESLTKVISVFISFLNKEDCSSYFPEGVPNL